MEGNENHEKIERNEISVQPSWGLARTMKYGITAKGKATKVNTTGDDYIKMNKQVFMNKDFLKNTMIVKIEFTVQSTVMLICNFILNVADGRVYSRGKGILGRDVMGQGNSQKDFYQVMFKNDSNTSKKIIIVNLSAGDLHVLALDADKNIWAWGSNKFKQIMVSKECEYVYPVLVDLKRQDLQICQMFALAKTSLYVCKKNRIFMIGSTKEGFLGNYNINRKLLGEFTTEMLEMKQVSDYLEKLIKSSNKNYEDQFLSCKRSN